MAEVMAGGASYDSDTAFAELSRSYGGNTREEVFCAVYVSQFPSGSTAQPLADYARFKSGHGLPPYVQAAITAIAGCES